ncbi:MAG: hypothetical protein ACTSYA_01665, partial [Candidatus Kariarchaeaceae archaeon]
MSKQLFSSSIQLAILVVLMLSSLFYTVQNESIIDLPGKDRKETIELPGEKNVQTYVNDFIQPDEQTNLSSFYNNQSVVDSNYAKLVQNQQPIISYDTWYEGETVKTEFIPRSKTIKTIVDEYESSGYVASVDLLTNGGLPGTYVNDNLERNITITGGLFINRNLTGVYEIETKYLDGDFTIDVLTDAHDTTNGHHSIISISDALTISEEYVSSYGSITVKFISCADVNFIPLELTSYLYVYVFNYQDIGWDLLSSDSNIESISGSLSLSGDLTLCIDYVNFQPSVIEVNTRSTFKYSSSTQILHEVELINFDTGTEINIYAPLSWNFSSVNPLASVEFSSSSDTWNISSTVETTYIITFISGSGWGVDYARQAQYLAVSDYSLDYAQTGFESGDYDGLIERTNQLVDSINLDTSIVSERAFSLRLEDDDSGSAFMLYYPLGLTNFEVGDYHLSFDLYIEETQGSENFNFASFNGGSLFTIDLEDYAKNRWHKFYTFMEMRGTVQYSGMDYATYFLIYLSSATTGDTILYLDNIEIWKANPAISTQDYSQSLIEAQMISWDGYLNPSVSNIETTLQLRDRCDNELIKEWALTTDNDGLVQTTFRGTLEQKEYEIRLLCYDNYFQNNVFRSQPIEEGLETANIAAGDWGTTTTLEIVEDVAYSRVGANVYHFDGSDADNNNYFRINSYQGVGIFDLSQFDAFTLSMHSDGTDPETTFDVLLQTDWGDTWQFANLYQTVEGWSTLRYSIDDDYTSEVGNYDATSVDWIRWDNDWSEGSIELYFDDIHFISGQRSYFTPSVASSLDYAETKEGNAWDFTEETREFLISKINTPIDIITENGYISYTVDGSNEG